MTLTGLNCGEWQTVNKAVRVCKWYWQVGLVMSVRDCRQGCWSDPLTGMNCAVWQFKTQNTFEGTVNKKNNQVVWEHCTTLFLYCMVWQTKKQLKCECSCKRLTFKGFVTWYWMISWHVGYIRWNIQRGSFFITVKRILAKWQHFLVFQSTTKVISHKKHNNHMLQGKVKFPVHIT